MTDRGAMRVLEIGSSQGGSTDQILRDLVGIEVTIVDPCLDADLVAKYRDVPAVTVHPHRSLELRPLF